MSEKNENLTTNVELDSTANGTVSFATDVVATIAGLAATEVEGVAAMINNGNMGLVDMLRKNQSNRALTRGVKVEISGDKVVVQLNVTVDYGAPVPNVAREIQENVKRAIETMTGLEVPEINIYIQGISFEKENRAIAELEQKQRQAITAGREEKPAEIAAEPAAEAEPADEDERKDKRAGSLFGLRKQADEVKPADEPAEPAVETVEAPAAEAEDEDEPVCDGRCDECTLECDARQKSDDEQDGE